MAIRVEKNWENSAQAQSDSYTIKLQFHRWKRKSANSKTISTALFWPKYLYLCILIDDACQVFQLRKEMDFLHFICGLATEPNQYTNARNGIGNECLFVLRVWQTLPNQSVNRLPIVIVEIIRRQSIKRNNANCICGAERSECPIKLKRLAREKCTSRKARRKS